jgi:hypothetical protein
MSKKVVKVSIPYEIYNNFLLSGTVIDRPGLPLLKIIEAIPLDEEKITVSIEVSPYSRKTPKTKRGEG